MLKLEGSRLTIETTTPRLLRRGAQTPSDTLRVLYNFAVDAIRELELESAGLDLEELEETKVAIRAEQGVKVKVAEEEVEEIRFADLEKAEVEVEKPREEPVILYVAATITAVAIGFLAYLLLKRR